MKKLFTFIALAMSFMGGYAQSYEWNFSDWTQSSISSTETIDGLTIYATTKTVTLDSNSQTVDDVTYSKRFKFGGKAIIKDITKLDRVISFEADGPVSVSVVAASSGSDSRELTFSSISSDVSDKTLSEFGTLSYAKAASSGVVSYTGGKGTVYIYGKNAALNLYAIKVCSTLTTAASTFSTYAASYPVNYKDLGLTAYGIGLDETAKKVTYTEIDGIVPANTPVLVKGEASKTYSLAKAEGDAATVSTNLKVSDGTIEGDGSTIYAFGTKDGVSGFKIVRAGVKIPAKKGYLQLSSSSTGAKDFFAFGGETTGINNISANGIDEEETPLFNLAGQRVNKSYKGVVVKNGKKFVNK